jgi:hypothetical protein
MVTLHSERAATRKLVAAVAALLALAVFQAGCGPGGVTGGQRTDAIQQGAGAATGEQLASQEPTSPQATVEQVAAIMKDAPPMKEPVRDVPAEVHKVFAKPKASASAVADVEAVIKDYVEANALGDLATMQKNMTPDAIRRWTQGDVMAFMSGYTVHVTSVKPTRASAVVRYDIAYYGVDREKSMAGHPIDDAFELVKVGQAWLVDKGGDGLTTYAR